MALSERINRIVIAVSSRGTERAASDILKIAKAADKSSNAMKTFARSNDAAFGKFQSRQRAKALAIERSYGRSFSKIRKHITATQGAFSKFSRNISAKSIKVKSSLAKLTDGFFTLRNGIIGLGAITLGRSFIEIADAATLMDNKLRLVTNSTKQLNDLYASLRKMSLATRSSINSNVDAFFRLANATKNLSLTQQELLQITDTVNKTFSIAGTPAAYAEMATEQLMQGLSIGILRGQDLKTVMQQNSVLSEILAKHANKTGLALEVLGRDATGPGDLRALASSDGVTGQFSTDAILAAKDAIDKQYATLGVPISGALQNLSTRFIDLTKRVNDFTGASEKITKVIVIFTEHLGKLLVVAGALAAITIGPSLIKGLKFIATFTGAGFLTFLVKATSGGTSLLKVLLAITRLHPVLAATTTLAAGAVGAYSIYKKRKADARREKESVARRVKESVTPEFLGEGSRSPGANPSTRGMNSLGLFGVIGPRVDHPVSSAQLDEMEREKRYRGNLNAYDSERNMSPFDRMVENRSDIARGGETGSIIPPKLLAEIKEHSKQQLLLTKVQTEKQGEEHSKRLMAINTVSERISQQKAGGAQEGGSNPFETTGSSGAAQEGGWQGAGESQGSWDGVSSGLDSVISRGDSVAAVGNTIRTSFSLAKFAIMDFARTGKSSMSNFMSSIGQTLMGAGLDVLMGGLAGSLKGLMGGGGGEALAGAATSGVGVKFGPGFATGGSFTVGGRGGTDSKLVQFMATPGERVNVRRPADKGADGGGPAGGIKIVNVIDPQEAISAMSSISGEQIILNAINRNPDVVRRILGAL